MPRSGSVNGIGSAYRLSIVGQPLNLPALNSVSVLDCPIGMYASLLNASFWIVAYACFLAVSSLVAPMVTSASSTAGLRDRGEVWSARRPLGLGFALLWEAVFREDGSRPAYTVVI